ncbi:MAG: hypothetical protein LBE79_08065 [Tannerella sp.]|jgi:hypothetical protein|nr:hypothetical protein [Tannerella sp.]
MKKSMLLLSLLTLAWMSCEGPMGPPGEPGEGVLWKIYNYKVYDKDWKLVGRPGALGSYFMFEFKEPELTNFVCEKGNVFGYRWLDQNTQTPLGQVVVVGESDNQGNEFLFTEVYSFSFRPGYITFYIDYSDFATDIRPGTCDFRIVLNY